jgi:hypothetical protein
VLQTDSTQTTTITTTSMAPKALKKDSGIFIRLTPKEKDALQLVANKQDRTIADWARLVFRKELKELGFLAEAEEFKVARVFPKTGTD